MPDRTQHLSGREQIQRVEELLAGVHDLVASLQRLGSELEQEVAHALYRDEAAGASLQSRLELENARLARALEDRAVIEQAKGMIVAGRGGSAGEAFAVLTAISRREQRSVHDVAAGVVRAGARAGARFAEQHRAQPEEDAAPAAATTGTEQSDGAAGTGETTDAATASAAAPGDKAGRPAQEIPPAAVADGAEEADEQAEIDAQPDVFDLTGLPTTSRWRLSAPAHSSSPRRGPLRYRTSH